MARLATPADAGLVTTELALGDQFWTDEAANECLSEPNSVVVLGTGSGVLVLRYSPPAALTVGPHADTGGVLAQFTRLVGMWKLANIELRTRFPSLVEAGITAEGQVWADRAAFRTRLEQRLQLFAWNGTEGWRDMPDGSRIYRFNWKRIMDRVRAL